MNIDEIMNSLTEEKKVALQEELDTIKELLANQIISESEFATLEKKTVDTFVVEFKADGENSETADPVQAAGGSAKKRKADVFKSNNEQSADTVPDLAGIKGGKLLDSGKDAKQAPARLADKRNVKEELFSGDETISEEFKTKAAALYEAHLAEAVAEETTRLEEEFATKLEEEIARLETKMDEYLDHIVDQWLEENEVAIESSAKVAVAESFMSELKALFEAHNINVEDTEISVVESMENEIAELEKALNEAVAKNIEFEAMISEATREEVVSEIAEGLTDTQKERLSVLSEKISYADMDEFKSKVSTIKENMIVGKKTVKAEEMLNEEFDGEVVTEPKLDDAMAGYVKAASTIFKI